MTEPEETAPVKSQPPGFFAELKRRKVMRVAAVYAVVGWLIIQVANATFADFDIPVWAFRFVVLMVVLGFPIALVLAWAFELTPEGITTTRTARQQQGATPAPPEHQKKRNWLAYAVGAAIPTVIFGVIAVVFYFTVREPEAPEISVEPMPETPDKSIAVLPFDNRSSNPEDAYFTDGIHDDLLTLISHIRDIKTISRTSVMQYRENRPNLRTIGEELDVAKILEGGVQRAGDQVRINVQLIDAATDAHLWAETYTRELTAENVFRIQSEIAGEIANRLQALLSPEEQKQLERLPTANLAALEAYFKGAGLTYAADDVAESIGHYQRAIELDPGFALAYAKLGEAYIYQVWLSGLSAGEQIAKAEPLIDKALELDPLLSEGHAALGLLRQYQEDLAGAEAAFQRAIELNPNNALAYQLYGTLLARHLGNVEQGLVMQTKYEELDPEALGFKHVKAEYLSMLGRIDEARAVLENLVRDYPEQAEFHRSLSMVYDDFGLYDQAVVVLRRGHALDPGNPVMPQLIARAYQRLGATEDEAFWLERTLALAPELDEWYGSAIRNRIRLHIIKGELAEADALWWREWKPDQTGSSGLWELMNADFAAGRFEAPRARYFKVHPQWFEPNATIPQDRNSLWDVVDVARSLIATGEQQQAGYLLDKIIEKLDAFPASGWTWSLRVYIPAVKGDAAATMRTIHAYVAFAGRPDDRLYAEPMLGLLQSNPEFQAVFGDVPGTRREQLAHLRAMEAAGELAPIPPLPQGAE